MRKILMSAVALAAMAAPALAAAPGGSFVNKALCDSRTSHSLCFTVESDKPGTIVRGLPYTTIHDSTQLGQQTSLTQLRHTCNHGVVTKYCPFAHYYGNPNGPLRGGLVVRLSNYFTGHGYTAHGHGWLASMWDITQVSGNGNLFVEYGSLLISVTATNAAASAGAALFVCAGPRGHPLIFKGWYVRRLSVLPASCNWRIRPEPK